MTELKPCPFCGFSAFIEETDPEWKDQFPYRIICGNNGCAGSHSWASTEEEAITAWTTRQTVDKILLKRAYSLGYDSGRAGNSSLEHGWDRDKDFFNDLYP